MKFKGLTLDIGMVSAQLNTDCKKCTSDDLKKLCPACARLSSLYASSLDNPHSSIVIFPPRLYSMLLNRTSPVTYFDVIIAYNATLDAIKGICDPNSPYMKHDKEWTAGAKRARVVAWEMLQKMIQEVPLRAQKLRPRHGAMRPTRLEFVQFAEDIVIHAMAIMHVVSVDNLAHGNKDALNELVQMSRSARVNTHGATMLIPWQREWSRANGDCIENVFNQNDEWNEARNRVVRERMFSKIEVKKGL